MTQQTDRQTRVGLFNTIRLGPRQEEIDFDKCEKEITNLLENDWIGFKYSNQLTLKRDTILKRIDQCMSQLSIGDSNIVIYCDFTFSQELDLYIKQTDFRKDFLDQSPPNTGVKIKQLDLYQALKELKQKLFNETNQFSQKLLQQQQYKGNIWDQVDWYLKNIEGDDIMKQAEKHRQNMINQIKVSNDLSQYIEFSLYLENYFQMFDKFTIQQREDAYQSFKQLLFNLKDQTQQKAYWNQNFYQNTLKYKNRKFTINLLGILSDSILIPNFLWNEIQHNQAQGIILCAMVDMEQFILNFKVIKLILDKFKQDQQRRPNNIPNNIPNQRQQHF